MSFLSARRMETDIFGVFWYVVCQLTKAMDLSIKFLLVLVVAFFAQRLSSQSVVWSDVILGASSEYSDREFSMKQVVGPPNKWPATGSSAVAWSPYTPDKGHEWIMVGFSKPQMVRQIVVAETYNPGAIARITLIALGSKIPIVVYETSENVALGNGRLASFAVDPGVDMVSAVKVDFNTAGVSGYQHIDAIGVSASSEPVEVRISEASFDFLSHPQPVTSLNSAAAEVAPMLSPDGEWLYFTRSGHSANLGGGGDDIWRAQASGKTWLTPENLNSPWNSTADNYLCGLDMVRRQWLVGTTRQDRTPELVLYDSVSPTAMTVASLVNEAKSGSYWLHSSGNLLLLSIKTPESQGSKDIYVSERLPNGTWSKPQNLGVDVNTAADEISPFLSEDQQLLFFSSDGHRGFGSHDIFMCRRKGEGWTSWTKPTNLGQTINSKGWDAYFVLPNTGDWAYFSSTNKSVGSADIFRIRVKPEEFGRVNGVLKVRVTDAATRSPLDATVSILEEPFGKTPKGPGAFDFDLGFRPRLTLRIEKKGYLLDERLLELAYPLDTTMEIALFKLNEANNISLEGVTFPANSPELPRSAHQALDIWVDYLKAHPGVRIEIGGHTNGHCTASGCQQLSEDRAKAVLLYLVKAGIYPYRLEFKGYGSSRPIADNATVQGRQANQRVEIRLL